METAIFNIRQGTTPVLRFYMNPQEPITGWTTQLVLKTSPTGNVVLTVAGIIAPDILHAEQIGVFQVTIARGDTFSLILNKTYHWYFERIDLGFEDVFAGGSVDVIPK
jgi:hypothetical protein